MLSKPARQSACRWSGALVATVAALTEWGGCSAPAIPPATLTAESGATAFSARNLDDPSLRRYLQLNLGHPPTTWDFEALCWVGFYYQPALELARAQWATARAARTTATQRPNPTLTLSPGYDFTRQPGVSPWMPSLNLDVLLQTRGKRARQQDIAAADAEAARLGVFTAAWQMRRELRKALADAAIASRRATLLQAQVALQQRLLTLLEQRFAAGSIAVSDVALTRSALLRAESAAADASSQAVTARTRVATALGVPAAALQAVALPDVTPMKPLSAEALATARRQSLQSRADVLAALAKYHSAQASLELEVARRTPDVHLGPGYQYDQGLNKWSLGISFELPVFNHNEGPIAEALARRAEAAAQFNVVQGQALGAIDAAEAAWRAAEQQLDKARQLGRETRVQAELAAQRVQLGAGDQVELQAARLDVATADGALLDAEAATAAAAGDLEDALQIPFEHLGSVADPAQTESYRSS